MTKNDTYLIIVQDWEESERGWGVRPDGHSIHLSMEECKEFSKEFWVKEKENKAPGYVPDCYTRESGKPYPFDTNQKTYKMLLQLRKEGRTGTWVSDLQSIEPDFKVKEREAEAQRKKEEAEALLRHVEDLKKSGLSKLTEEEKKVLGLLDKPKTTTSADYNRGWQTLSGGWK